MPSVKRHVRDDAMINEAENARVRTSTLRSENTMQEQPKGRDAEQNRRGEHSDRDSRVRPDVTAPASSPSPADQQLRQSRLSPNELDRTDESQKADDITREGARRATSEVPDRSSAR